MADITLYDAYGRPVERRDLVRQIAVAEIAGIRRLYDETVATGMTPTRLARVLRDAAEGYNEDYLTLAEEIEERYQHYYSVLGTRKRAVTGIEVAVEAASDEARDIEIADEVRSLVTQPEFGELCDDLLDALGKGYSVAEILWQQSAKMWWPRGYQHIDPRWFVFDRETRREIRLRDGLDGAPLAAYKFIRHIPRLKTGLTLRSGLARFTAWAWLFHNFSVRDWVSFAEVYGVPMRVGRYGPGATDQDIRTLAAAIAGLGSNAAAVIPKSMEIEIKEAAGAAGSNDLFERLANYHDRAVSKAVLGQTLTTDTSGGTGTFAAANTHNEVRLDILRADGRQLAWTLQRDLVEVFVNLNWGEPPNGYPKLRIEATEPEDLKAWSEAVTPWVERGLRVRAAQVRAKLGLEEPEKNDELVERPAAPSPEPRGLDFAAEPPRRATAAEPTDEPGPLDTWTDEAAAEELAEWEEVIAPITDPILAVIESSETYEEAIARLEAMEPDMDTTRLEASLARALFRARIIGNVSDD